MSNQPYTLSGVLRDALTGNLAFTEGSKAKERYDICKACPNFQATLTCGLCGCFMPGKVKLENATCPAGKW